MLSKNEAKYIQSLYHKKTRETEGVFVVEGPKMIDELAASNYTIRKIYATDEWAKPAGITADVITVSDDELQRISGLQAANKVLAVAEQSKAGSPVFIGNVVLALDCIQDPGNLGTIIRIADWFGIKHIVASKDTVELYNPKTIQSTMGSFVRVNVFYDDLSKVLQDAGTAIYGAVLDGQDVLGMQPLQEGVIVIGNESKGIGDAVRRMITVPVAIPRFGGAESLNAAVATGIILSHLIG